LLRRLAIESKVNVDEWVYPRVSCVVSWYSILDEKAWRGGEWLSPGLAAVWDMYLPSGALGELQGRATICQWEEEIHAYPPTLLIVGSYDPLGLRHSSEAALQMLQRRNVPVQLRVFDATHGFVGYPPQMQSALNGGDPSHWLQNCAEATKATVGFLKENHGHEQRLPGPVR
jgi:acetyl esterase/lipase